MYSALFGSLQEELEKIKQQGASDDEQKRLIEQHERDLQNILNKMDADKMRMQSNLQERLKKKKEERLRNKQEELKENFKEQKRELEQKQKSEINRIKKDEVGIYWVWVLLWWGSIEIRDVIIN